ncbi:unnamed protein product [Adineta ricciae]|uniref:Nuclear receptor domain-containing protein n=1 Tax=Adineta ricciae TaxID=249248 RepID=A0A815LCA1_ADIRI|nr:unnamed protein product [Adineta ricciae]
MATEKKLIYITSDEQLVHEVSLKRSKNTYIVDLDTGEPISATVSKHSSTSDRNNQQSKRSRKSITNSRCVICGDHAIGYNYDVLSCASCKAFFYGHAYENLIKMFDSMNENVAANNIEDFDIIQNVQSLFLFYFENQFDHLPETFDLSDNVSAIISWAQHDSEIALQTIRFFRQITEFENLHADDRFILIKYNLFPLMLIRKSYNYRPTILRNAVEIQQEEERATRAQILFQMSNDLISRSNLLTLVIIQFTEHDPILLSLLLVIGLFSPTLSLNLDEPIFKDSLSIYRAQAIYTKILWNYLIMKQSEAKAQQKFVQLMEILLRIQLANVTARKFLHDQITTTNTVDRITALMQTILQIS